jgi:hypothetical protein
MRFSDAFIADAFVIACPADDFIPTIDLTMILAQVGLGLGLIGACVEMVERENKTGPATNRYLDDQDDDLAEALGALRLQTFALAERCGDGSAARRVVRARAARGELRALARRRERLPHPAPSAAAPARSVLHRYRDARPQASPPRTRAAGMSAKQLRLTALTSGGG